MMDGAYMLPEDEVERASRWVVVGFWLTVAAIGVWFWACVYYAVSVVAGWIA